MLHNKIKVKQPVEQNNNFLHWNVNKPHLKQIISRIKK